LNENAETLNENAETLNENTETLNENAETLNENTETLNESTETLNENAETLNESTETLNENAETLNENAEISETLQSKRMMRKELEETVLLLCSNEYLTVNQIAKLVGKSSTYLLNEVIPSLIDNQKLVRLFPGIPKHKKQAYKTNHSPDNNPN